MPTLPENADDLVRTAISLVCEMRIIEDWEFQTIFGEPPDVYCNHRYISATTNTDDLSRGIAAIGNIVGYPHGQVAYIEERMGIDVKTLQEFLKVLVDYRAHMATRASPPGIV
jgi:hypothetical protein